MTFTIITRSLIVYFLVLFILRFMGKRQLGEMQPYELVITLIIADLACIPMAETALPLLHGIIPLITLVCVHFLISFLERKSIKFRKILNGKPIILINPSGIDFDNLKKCNMNFNDLQETLRSSGYFNLDEILYAIMQTNGQLSVLPRSAYAPLTANDIQLNLDEASLPIIIFAEGKTITENMQLAKIDEKFLKQECMKAGFKDLKNIMIITLDSNGKMYIQGFTGEFKAFQSSFQGGDW